jgi:hypothetical protein
MAVILTFESKPLIISLTFNNLFCLSRAEFNYDPKHTFNYSSCFT